MEKFHFDSIFCAPNLVWHSDKHRVMYLRRMNKLTCMTSSQHALFYYSAIKDWNGLPDSIKSIKDNIKFKFEVKKFLQSQNVSEDQNIYIYF